MKIIELKKISELRRIKALELRDGGMTYDKIGKEVGFTRERARQIVLAEKRRIRREADFLSSDGSAGKGGL